MAAACGGGNGTTPGDAHAADAAEADATGVDCTVCSAHATCDLAAAKPCSCAAGFSGDGTTAGTGCTDIDECTLGTDSCGSFACANTPGSYHCDGLFAAAAFDGVLARLEPQTYQLLDLVAVTAVATPPLVASPVQGIMSMVRDPQSGVVYALARANSNTGRMFGTLDLNTAVFAEISEVDRFAGLEITPDGTLYGITGSGASTRRTLHTIDKVTGSVTVIDVLPNGGGGETICYDTDAALMYHWTGGGSIMDSFPLTTPLVTTSVTLSNSDLSEVFGCRYVGNHTFLLYDLNQHVRVVTADGVVSTIPSAVDAMFSYVRSAVPTTMTMPHNLAPAAGSSAGGDSVTLHGLGLLGTTAVAFGGVAAASFTVVDDTTVTAVTAPVLTAPLVAAPVDVTAVGPVNTATWPGAYTFVDGPMPPAVPRPRATARPTSTRVTTSASAGSAPLNKTRRMH